MELVLPEEIPSFDVSEEEAFEHAKQTRSAYIAFERRKIEAREAVAVVRGGLYQVGLSASYGLNNVAPQFSDLYTTTLELLRRIWDWSKAVCLVEPPTAFVRREYPQCDFILSLRRERRECVVQ